MIFKFFDLRNIGNLLTTGSTPTGKNARRVSRGVGAVCGVAPVGSMSRAGFAYGCANQAIPTTMSLAQTVALALASFGPRVKRRILGDCVAEIAALTSSSAAISTHKEER